MSVPNIDEAGRSCIERYMEKPALRRGTYGWGTVALAYSALLVMCVLLTTVIGSVLAILGQRAEPAWAPIFTVLQLAAIAI